MKKKERFKDADNKTGYLVYDNSEKVIKEFVQDFKESLKTNTESKEAKLISSSLLQRIYLFRDQKVVTTFIKPYTFILSLSK